MLDFYPLTSKFFFLYLTTASLFLIGFTLYNKFKKKEEEEGGATKLNLVNAFLVSLSFSFLGLSIGIILGLSKSPLGEVIISTIFTLIGGFSVYIFANKDNEHFKEENQAYLSIIIIGLSFFLIVGVETANRERMKAESFIKKQELEIKKEFERYKLELRYHEVKQDILKAKEAGVKQKDGD